MVSSIRMDRDVPVEMRDGTVLRADVYRPNDNQKYPAILFRTPYDKRLSGDSDFLNPVDTVFAGYALVVQDVRGRFRSEGEYRRGDRPVVEGPDGYDSIEWIASQPWCDGNVGMAGASYLAHLQWIAARENPPHLKAIAPWMGPAGPLFDQSFVSGVVCLHIAANWVPGMALDIADRLEKRGQDVSQMRRMFYRALFNPEEVYGFLPLKEVPHFKFEGASEMWNNMALNAIPTPDLADKAYWPYHQIMVPCYHVSGWYDLHTWAVFKNFLNMREQGGSQLAREGQHVFIGPWIHGHRISHIVGDLNFGPSANPQGARATEYQLAFFNKYLRAMNVELPAIRYFVMGRNRWRDAETWPLPETQWQRCFLHSKGRANTSEGDGTLSWDNPGSEPTDTFVYDPHLSVPTTGGRILPQAGLVPGPRDQSHIEKRNDVLCYATHELQNDIEVTGPLKVRLFASTSVKDTDFTAKLVDVHPDSHAYNVAEGIIRARYRKSIYRPELVSPGEIIEYTIDMANLSHVFRRGHYIRLDISSSNFPAFDRNMNTGNPMGEDIKGIPATQTIFHQSEYPSYIDLPVIPPSR